jgi:hypothetical protein
LFCYKNNVLAKTITSIPTDKPLLPGIRDNISTAIVANFNFGQRSFTYTPPSGYVALCTNNLPASTIKNGQKYFDISLYTGNGGNQNITGINFQPDMFWGKSRSTVNNHGLVDAVRGGLNALYPNLTNAETSDGIVTAWNSNGVSLGNSATTNSNGASYVGWMWKAGDSTVTNTNGTITSQVRANPTAGFSIVTYTGAGGTSTVGHGLGIAPSFIAVKPRSLVDDWPVYHKSLTANGRVFLNRTDAYATGLPWGSTTPTSSVFTVGNVGTNTNAGTYVAYCFAEIPGFSAFGSYPGNGSGDGTFVYTGFRPRFIMIKSSGSLDDWQIRDTARDLFNLTDDQLLANTTEASSTATNAVLDILSNGFKLRGNQSSTNNNGTIYIYMAFAENPFAHSNAR